MTDRNERTDSQGWQLTDGQAYRVTDWQRYEVNNKGRDSQSGQTLQKKPLGFIRWGQCLTTGTLYGLSWHTGWKILIEVAEREDLSAMLALGLFGKILEVAGGKEATYRGWITDADLIPLDAETLADQTGFRLAEVESALKLLCHPAVGWLAPEKYPHLGKISQRVREQNHQRRQIGKMDNFPANSGKAGEAEQSSRFSGKGGAVQEPKTEVEVKLKENAAGVPGGGEADPPPAACPSISDFGTSALRTSAVSDLGASDPRASAGAGRGRGKEQKISGQKGDPIQTCWKKLSIDMMDWDLENFEPERILDNLPEQTEHREVILIRAAIMVINHLFEHNMNANSPQGRSDQTTFLGKKNDEKKPGLIRETYESLGEEGILQAIRLMQLTRRKELEEKNPLNKPMAYLQKKIKEQILKFESVGFNNCRSP